MTFSGWVSTFSLAGGIFFLLVGSIGLVRLPDVYTRMHATGKCDTLGSGMILFALILQMATVTDVVKLLLIGVLMFTINPVVTHAIARTAYDSGNPIFEGSFFLDHYSPQAKEDSDNAGD